MPHIINTNTGYCETHNKFEYIVLEAGSVTDAKLKANSNKLNKIQASLLPDQKSQSNPVYNAKLNSLPIDSFQVKVFEDNENAIYKHSSKSKLKSKPKRILVENEMVFFIFYLFFGGIIKCILYFLISKNLQSNSSIAFHQKERCCYIIKVISQFIKQIFVRIFRRLFVVVETSSFFKHHHMLWLL